MSSNAEGFFVGSNLHTEVLLTVRGTPKDGAPIYVATKLSPEAARKLGRELVDAADLVEQRSRV